MAMFSRIPTRPGQAQRLRVSLNGTFYTLVLSWNRASTCWVLDIYDSAGTTAVVRGIALVTGTDLLGQFRYLPIADQAGMMAITTGPGNSPDTVPTFENLGIDGQLLYVTP